MFVIDLKPGKLIRNKNIVYVYIVPNDKKQTMFKIELKKDSYLLALSAVRKILYGKCSINSKILYKYQFFALYNEQIVSFTCVSSTDSLIQNIFEVFEIKMNPNYQIGSKI